MLTQADKVFISGKISGDPLYKSKFNYVANQLSSYYGCKVINPAILPLGFEHKEYMRICKAMIDCCDTVFVLFDYEDSEGAMEEVKYASNNAIRIIHFDELYRDKMISELKELADYYSRNGDIDTSAMALRYIQSIL